MVKISNGWEVFFLAQNIRLFVLYPFLKLKMGVTGLDFILGGFKGQQKLMENGKFRDIFIIFIDKKILTGEKFIKNVQNVEKNKTNHNMK